MQTSIEPRFEQVQCRAGHGYVIVPPKLPTCCSQPGLVRRFARQRRDTGDQGVLTSGLGALLTMLDKVQSAAAFSPSGQASHQLAEAEHSLSATPRRLSKGTKKKAAFLSSLFPNSSHLPWCRAPRSARSAPSASRLPQDAHLAAQCTPCAASASLPTNDSNQSIDGDALCPFTLPCRACSDPRTLHPSDWCSHVLPRCSYCAQQQLRATVIRCSRSARST